MSNQFFVPFNRQPVNTGRGNEGSTYTVPSGKYARVMITMQTEVYLSTIETNALGNLDIQDDSKHVTFELWLDEAEVLDFTTSTSAPQNVGLSSQTAYGLVTSEITADVDGNPVSICRARGHLYARLQSGTFSTGNDFAASASAEFRYEEFNKIS